MEAFVSALNNWMSSNNGCRLFNACIVEIQNAFFETQSNHFKRILSRLFQMRLSA